MVIYKLRDCLLYTSFGILNTNEDLRVTEFLEKPEHPISTKASMGIYIFSWQQDVYKRQLWGCG